MSDLTFILSSDDDPDGLLKATMKGKFNKVQYLINQGVDVNQYNCFNETPLMFAVAKGFYYIAKLLLDNGASVNYRQPRNNSGALLVAITYNKFNCVELLLDYDADTYVANHKGYTALMIASENGYSDIVKLLLERKVYVDAVNEWTGRTALIIASKNGHYDIVELLLESNADIDIKDMEKKTALMHVEYHISYKYREIVQLLKNADKK